MWDGEPIVIRPSSIDSFYGCSFQWAKVFLEGRRTIPNARAAIGTAVHKGVEEMWKESMLRKSKDQINLSMATDAAIEEFQNVDDDVQYDQGENANTAQELIQDGVRVYVEDIVPFADIPEAVEEWFEIPINHKVVEKIGGTIDYRTSSELDDLKTSKRKPIVQSYVTQQTTYKILAEANGKTVKNQRIQAVAFTKQPVGYMLELEPDVPRTKYLINHMLDTLEAFYDGTDPRLLFRGNPKYMFCSDKFCVLHSCGCPYANGEVE